MTVQALQGFPDSQMCFEYTVGAARNEFLYPGIQQCISLTGFNVSGLLGTHISPGSSTLDIDKTFNVLRSGGGANYPDWYIVGQFEEHFKHTKVNWNSIDKIVKSLRKNLSKTANLHFFDTSPIVKREGWSWGIDIKAERAVFGIDFSYAKPGGLNTKLFTSMTEDFLKK